MSVCIDNPIFYQEIPEKGAARGHIRFSVKGRTPENVALAGFCANITASVLFERMQAQGTNIILQLTKEEARIEVIARAEDDKLNLLWEGKQVDPGQMNDIQERIRNKTFFIGTEAPPLAAPKSETQEVTPKPDARPSEPPLDVHTEEEEDYLTKQLHRIP